MTELSQWTIKGLRIFFPCFYYWPNFVFFVQTFWENKLLGKFVSKAEFQLIFQYFCYIIILEKSPHQKNEMMGYIKDVWCCLAICQRDFGVFGPPTNTFSSH
jgi:hypothetical protein